MAVIKRAKGRKPMIEGVAAGGYWSQVGADKMANISNDHKSIVEGQAFGSWSKSKNAIYGISIWHELEQKYYYVQLTAVERDDIVKFWIDADRRHVERD